MGEREERTVVDAISPFTCVLFRMDDPSAHAQKVQDLINLFGGLVGVQDEEAAWDNL